MEGWRGAGVEGWRGGGVEGCRGGGGGGVEGVEGWQRVSADLVEVWRQTLNYEVLFVSGSLFCDGCPSDSRAAPQVSGQSFLRAALRFEWRWVRCMPWYAC